MASTVPNFDPSTLAGLLSGGGSSRSVGTQLGATKAQANLINDPFFRSGAGDAFGLVGQRGAMDPRYLNAILGQIQRNTAGDVDAFRSGAVQAGLGGSGMAQAIQAALQNAGSQRQYQATAEEARMAEERYRSDLDRLMALMGMGRQEAQFQHSANLQRSAQKGQQKVGYINAAANLLGAVSGFKMPGGG